MDDYKYLGSCISSSEKDFKTRKALAWVACNKLHKIWSSNLIDNSLKTKIFKTCVEPILLYGSETWSLTKKLEDQLDGTYTRLLVTKSLIYDGLMPISLLSKAQRAQFAGHCYRASSEVISNMLLWRPKQRARKFRKFAFPDFLNRDTIIPFDNLAQAMGDRQFWRERVESIVSTAVER